MILTLEGTANGNVPTYGDWCEDDLFQKAFGRDRHPSQTDEYDTL
jgi:hypothetical protein